jgi:HEAT repeat protein
LQRETVAPGWTVEESYPAHHIVDYVQEVLDRTALSQIHETLEDFEREADPSSLCRMALELKARLEGPVKERLLQIAVQGDSLHQEHALLALLGHADESSVQVMLQLAVASQPPAVHERALDGLLSVADQVPVALLGRVRDGARLWVEIGKPSDCSTALLILAELGVQEEEIPLVEQMASSLDARVSLAALRGLVEYHQRRHRADLAESTQRQISAVLHSMEEFQP